MIAAGTARTLRVQFDAVPVAARIVSATSMRQ
jgi:hypothetical protein